MDEDHRTYEVPIPQAGYQPPPPPPPPPSSKPSVTWGALVRSWRFWVLVGAAWIIGIGIGAATPPEEDDTQTASQRDTTTERETTTTEEETTTEAPTTTTTTTPPTTPAPTQPPGPATSFGDGTYVVNEDIAPGTYRTDGGDSCYWERLSGFNGSFDEIIANDLPSGPSLVTIEATDVGFTSEGCGTWELAG
jgi:hypothetical protein